MVSSVRLVAIVLSVELVSSVITETIALVRVGIVVLQSVVGCVPVGPLVISEVARHVGIVVLLLIQVPCVVWIGSAV